MTRGQMIFMFIMISTAVITGATLGIISHFPYIIHQSQVIQASTDVPGNTPANIPFEEKSQAEKRGPDSAALAVPATVSRNEPGNRSVQLMEITAQEKNEIRKMMQQLGMAEDQPEAEFIMEFQRNHNLQATGILDSQTLNLMIKEATYNKASRSAYTVMGR